MVAEVPVAATGAGAASALPATQSAIHASQSCKHSSTLIASICSGVGGSYVTTGGTDDDTAAVVAPLLVSAGMPLVEYAPQPIVDAGLLNGLCEYPAPETPEGPNLAGGAAAAAAAIALPHLMPLPLPPSGRGNRRDRSSASFCDV